MTFFIYNDPDLSVVIILTLFRMGIFRAAHGWGVPKRPPLPKICHTYPAMMKRSSYTLPKEDPKNISISWHIPWVLLTSAFFHRKSANFVISRNTGIDCILILMISAKMATPDLLETTVFWNNGYDVKIPVDGITNKISSRFKLYCRFVHVTKVW